VTGYAVEPIAAALQARIGVGTLEGQHHYLLINDANVIGMPLTAHLSAPAFLHAAGVSAVKTVAGCACCIGALAWRTELARLLRLVERPAKVWIVSNHWDHLDAMQAQLQSAPFDAYVTLEPRETV
jgi:hypothetical protein